MSLNFLTKSMWEGKKWIIPGYLISWNTIIPVNFVCVCVGIVSPMYYFLWSTYILHTYATSFLGKRDWVRECTAAMSCVILYTLVQNHVVKVFEPYMCSTCDCESIYFTWAISHLLFMLDKSNPETFQMIVCCISFFFNSTFICFFLVNESLFVAVLLHDLLQSYLMPTQVFDRTPD